MINEEQAIKAASIYISSLTSTKFAAVNARLLPIDEDRSGNRRRDAYWQVAFKKVLPPHIFETGMRFVQINAEDGSVLGML